MRMFAKISLLAASISTVLFSTQSVAENIKVISTNLSSPYQYGLPKTEMSRFTANYYYGETGIKKHDASTLNVAPPDDKKEFPYDFELEAKDPNYSYKNTVATKDKVDTSITPEILAVTTANDGNYIDFYSNTDYLQPLENTKTEEVSENESKLIATYTEYLNALNIWGKSTTKVPLSENAFRYIHNYGEFLRASIYWESQKPPIDNKNKISDTSDYSDYGAYLKGLMFLEDQKAKAAIKKNSLITKY